METSEKVVQLYKYLQELSVLKAPKVTDIRSQRWFCFFKDIPVDSEYISVFYRDNLEESMEDNDILLSVKKPEFTKCPNPPKSIEEWLEFGWEDYRNEAKYKEKLSELMDEPAKEEHIEKFENSRQRQEDFVGWILKRDNWVSIQKRIAEVRKIFMGLYQVYTALELEADSLELMVGEGLLQDTENTQINHPILLKRIAIVFDAKENIITLRDTEKESELYTMLFQIVNNISNEAIRTATEEIFEKGYHPLDRNCTKDFLERFVHRLSSEGKFIGSDENKINSDDRITVSSEPVFFLRKAFSGAFGAIGRIIDNIENTGFVPGSLKDIVDGGKVDIPTENPEETIEEKLASSGGESEEIFLSKQANREQLKIVERIERCNAVLVQGPPGTGKTHTIANIMGHFLAQGKRVLVTSQTKKALSVLKDKVPKEVQSLCVSMLDEDKKDMERSVDGIIDYVSTNSSAELKRKFESCKNERLELIKELADIRKKILVLRYQERKNIVFDGKGYSTIEVASFVNKNRDTLAYLPGKVRLNQSLPIAMTELSFLYKSNIEINEFEDDELAKALPEPEKIISAKEFRHFVEKEAEDDERLKEIEDKLGCKIKFDFKKDEVRIDQGAAKKIIAKKPNFESIEELRAYIANIGDAKDWMIQAIADGKKSGVHEQKWKKLISSIEDTTQARDVVIVDLLGKSIKIESEIDLQSLSLRLKKINGLFSNNGIISNIKLHFDKTLKKTLSQITINGENIKCLEECLLVQKYVEWNIKRQNLEYMWDELMSEYGAPKFEDLGGDAEEHCNGVISKIEQSLQWYSVEYVQLLSKINKAGSDGEIIFGQQDSASDVEWVGNIFNIIKNNLPALIYVTIVYLRQREINAMIQNSLEVLEDGVRSESIICQTLRNSLLNKDVGLYEEQHKELDRLYAKYSDVIRRNEIIEKIAFVAPEWADAIKNRRDIHGEGMLPESIEEAWKWKQFNGIIEEIISEPFEKYQQDVVSFSKKLREKTTEAAKWGAWYHLALRSEGNMDMRKALQGWKQTINRIGKTGKGKNVPVYRKQARALMARCQDSVPAWIMPINKALENFDAQKNSFDVAIIDEASQADVTSMALFYMAKKVIVVGDDKQVNPMAVGTNVDEARKLAERFLKQIFPLTWQLFDLKSSLYDVAGQTFQPLMLHEHFRCVPDIIGYSNKLSYDYKIKPLRSSGDSNLRPAIVSYRVKDGQRNGSKKTNRKEAEALVSLLVACTEQKEYDNMTFGVISLLGSEQAELIQRQIFERIGTEVIEKRKILCGDASHFQGDERDVIFLSLVDSSEGDGLLRKVGDGADESTKKRYNVAVSRARNQLFIVHSLDYANALKHEDLRRDLLEYSENPRAYTIMAEEVTARAESPFEEAVGKSLVAAGYHIKQQWEVGAYRIDMIAIYNKKSIAIECDGDKFHSGEEKIMQDMERQTILERLNWRFIRIRGSEYYRDPEGTMERVMRELNDYGIYPEKNIEKDEEIESTELLSRVKIRSTQLLNGWNLKQGIQNDNSQNLFDFEATQDEQIEVKNNKSYQHAPVYKDVEIDEEHMFEKTKKGIGQKKDFRTQVKSDNDNNCEKTITNLLKEKGISFIDNRKKSGIIWVLCEEMKKNEVIDKICKDFGVGYSFEKRGGAATQNRPAWRIMSN